MRTQGRDGCLHTKQRGLRRNQPCPHLGLRLPPASRTRDNTCGLSHPVCGALSRPYSTSVQGALAMGHALSPPIRVPFFLGTSHTPAMCFELFIKSPLPNKTGSDIHTPLYLKWITNEDLLYNTGNSAQYYVTT